MKEEKLIKFVQLPGRILKNFWINMVEVYRTFPETVKKNKTENLVNRIRIYRQS